MCQLLSSVFWCTYKNLPGSLTVFVCIRMQMYSCRPISFLPSTNDVYHHGLKINRFFRKLFRLGISLTLAMMLGLNIIKLSLCLESILSICQRCIKVIFFSTLPEVLCQCTPLYPSGTVPIHASIP